jgi:hypothetical protein
MVLNGLKAGAQVGRVASKALNIWKRVILLIVLIMPSDTQKVSKSPTPGATITPPNYTGPQWSNLRKELGLDGIELRPIVATGEISLTYKGYTSEDVKEKVIGMASAFKVTLSKDFVKDHRGEVFFAGSSDIPEGVVSWLEKGLGKFGVVVFKITGDTWEPISHTGAEWQELEYYERGSIDLDALDRAKSGHPLEVHINITSKEKLIEIAGKYEDDLIYRVAYQD